MEKVNPLSLQFVIINNIWTQDAVISQLKSMMSKKEEVVKEKDSLLIEIVRKSFFQLNFPWIPYRKLWYHHRTSNCRLWLRRWLRRILW